MDILRTLAVLVDTRPLPRVTTDNAISNILNVVMGTVAAIALLMIVIGGFRYILARGDPNNVAQARNTIMYAIIGLLVTMSAYAIVTFVVKGAA